MVELGWHHVLWPPHLPVGAAPSQTPGVPAQGRPQQPCVGVTSYPGPRPGLLWPPAFVNGVLLAQGLSCVFTHACGPFCCTTGVGRSWDGDALALDTYLSLYWPSSISSCGQSRVHWPPSHPTPHTMRGWHRGTVMLSKGQNILQTLNLHLSSSYYWTLCELWWSRVWHLSPGLWWGIMGTARCLTSFFWPLKKLN